MADEADAIAGELYALALDEFTAKRDARAKELRSSGDRELANEVKALRKPTASAWIVNQLARRERDALDSLLAAGDALRRAQSALGEGGGDARVLRDAATDERAAIDELVAATHEIAPRASAQTIEEVRETLHAAATDDEARELIDRGRLTAARRAVGLGGLDAFAAGAASSASTPAPVKSKKAKQSKEPKKAKKQERAAPPTRKAGHERLTRARRALEDAEAEQRARTEALRAAEQRARAAERELNDARGELDRARRAADRGDADVEKHRAELEDAQPSG